MKDLVSVIIPVYNGEKTIEKAIASVQSQSYTALQIIVIDDCSQDGTYKIVEALAKEDERIILIKNKVNLGVATSRNNGCKLVTGKYIAFLDSDDLWYPQKIELQLEYLNKTKAHLCYTSYEMVEKNSQDSIRYKVANKVDYKSLLKENIICCSSVLLERRLMEQNPFVSQYFHEDFILWLTILKQGYQAVGISQCLVIYQKGGRSADKVNAMKNRWRIYRSYEQLSTLKSIYYFMWYAINGIKKYYLTKMKYKVSIAKEQPKQYGTKNT